MSDSVHVNKEMYVPESMVFLDARPAYAIVIHKTASPGMSTAEAIATYFQKGSDGRDVSVHYVVGKDGVVVQCVHEKDGAGGNSALPVEAGRNILFNQAINWNLRTISIEHVDDSVDNTQPLTPQQKAASFALVKDIAQRKGIAPDHIVGHNALQPISKAKCPNNYPLEELRAYVIGETAGVTHPLQNKNGEILDVASVSQFWPGKTEYACGFYAASMVAHSGKPGAGATGDASAIEQWANTQYIREYGSDGANMVGGVSIDDMHRLLVAALPNSGTSHYYDLPISASSAQSSDIASIKGALRSGYPVVVTVTEISVYDTQLGRNPYWWGASGNHVFLITGIDTAGNFLVHDPANVTGSLQGANSPLPQPRHYDIGRIAVSWASMCRMPWLVPVPSGWIAATSTPLNQQGSPAPTPTPTPTPTPIQPSGDLHVEKLQGGPNTNVLIIHLWGGMYQRDTPIFVAWRNALLDGISYGYPIEAQQELPDEMNEPSYIQRFTGATAIQHIATNAVRWV